MVALAFSARRIYYNVMNFRHSKEWKAHWWIDAIVLMECLIFLNPFLFRFVVIKANINPTILALVYASLITACVLLPWMLVQKELGKKAAKR